jgi:glycosyltransferase involved in cell wall biosynthesis
MKKIKINFILPFSVKTGGVIVVLEYFRQLKILGHDVEIYYPLIPYWDLMPLKIKRTAKIKIFLKIMIKNVLKTNKNIITWHFEPVKIKSILLIKNIFIRNADVSIATAWPTAFDVAGLSPEKGEKYYFIQDYENWNGNIKLLNDSYRLPLKQITIAPWLSELMKKKFKQNVAAEILNGIRIEKFVPLSITKTECNSILMLYSRLERKGSKDGIAAFNKLLRKYQDIEITLFGICERPDYLDSRINYEQNPQVDKLVQLYQRATIFLFPSHCEGWGLPPMEAMACKCAVIATDVGCIRSIKNGKNVFIVETGNPDKIYEALIKLIENSQLRDMIAYEGYKTVQNYTWENAAAKLERVLLKHRIT